jgi:hypothetical protein
MQAAGLPGQDRAVSGKARKPWEDANIIGENKTKIKNIFRDCQ